MARGKRLTEEEIQQIAQQYLIKRNIKQVAKLLGLSQTAVKLHLQRLGIFTKTDKTNALTTEQTQLIVTRYEKGESAKQIAVSLNIPRSLVFKMLNNLGISRKRACLSYNSLSTDDIKHIADMYQSGRSSAEIAKEFSVSTDLVLKHVRSSGITTRDAGFYKKYCLSSDEINEIYQRHQNGDEWDHLASSYNMTVGTLKKLVKKSGLAILRKKSPNVSRKKLSFGQEGEVIELYKKGELFLDIAQKFGVSEHTIRRIVKSASISREKPVAGLKPSQVSEICNLYNKNISVHELAQTYNVSDYSIKKILASKGVF